ncbi:unnamed protein product [Cuscuta campestris]|uniref:Uncharacterized protein n=1 Tax=Cuscuta campestris TaxID=132261 RepID=A0A484N8J9_9ASTE|nr:unnamed protein product [Cuscuta campestris]
MSSSALDGFFSISSCPLLTRVATRQALADPLLPTLSNPRNYTGRLQTCRFACQWVIIAPPDAAQPGEATSLPSALFFLYKGLHPSSLFTFRDHVSELSPVKFLIFRYPALRVKQSSEDCSSEDSNSSSSTGSSSPESTPGQVPNSSIPDPHPVNQVPGETFVGRDDPVDDEPGPYDPEHETRDAWEERLHAADMEFEEFAIPDDQPAGETGGSQANTAKTFPVSPETVEILDEDEPQDNRSKGKEKEKAGRRVKKVATTHPSYAKKRARSDPEPAGQTIEEAFVNLGLRLKKAGEIGPLTADRLGLGSPSEFARLKKEKEEMALILKSQADELIRLSGLAGSMKTEISQLKEENGRLMDEVSEAKREMTEKEENFPGCAAAWVEENKAEAARVLRRAQKLPWNPSGFYTGSLKERR